MFGNSIKQTDYVEVTTVYGIPSMWNSMDTLFIRQRNNSIIWQSHSIMKFVGQKKFNEKIIMSKAITGEIVRAVDIKDARSVKQCLSNHSPPLTHKKNHLPQMGMVPMRNWE
jgi:hypothetical protein